MPQNQFQPGEVCPDEYYQSASLDLVIDLCERGDFAHAQHLASDLLLRAHGNWRVQVLRKLFTFIGLQPNSLVMRPSMLSGLDGQPNKK